PINTPPTLSLNNKPFGVYTKSGQGQGMDPFYLGLQFYHPDNNPS
ncbi:hypothetical protein LCGC14_2878860, partial [marine sediment metagenome]